MNDLFVQLGVATCTGLPIGFVQLNSGKNLLAVKVNCDDIDMSDQHYGDNTYLFLEGNNAYFYVGEVITHIHKDGLFHDFTFDPSTEPQLNHVNGSLNSDMLLRYIEMQLQLRESLFSDLIKTSHEFKLDTAYVIYDKISKIRSRTVLIVSIELLDKRTPAMKHFNVSH